MKTVEIQRLEQTDTHTLGVLMIDGIVTAMTLEDPDNGNQRNISCIPAGEYEAVRHTSPKFGETFHVQNVPGRSEIIFHAGNTHNDTRGCILLGARPSYNAKGERFISDSRIAMSSFLERLKGENRIKVIIRGAE
ncbi:DUF5675 family protein [Geovibrio ferrireducens]|uniref:DUF5675 family protein n=1 Tax=Geovibrio ferrireducens TaxID=46201 RepID=UPI0022487210|nr:DUF5675 family protein [Geovibrio ferrireducens]